MFILGIILISLGILLLFFAIYYAITQNVKQEMKEYKKLALSGVYDEEYEPPKPIERVYEKQPINSFISEEYKKAEVLNDDEVDKIIGDVDKEDTSILPEEFNNDSESTSILDDEDTSILSEESEENTSLLDKESTTLLDDENTSLLTEEKEVEDTMLLDEENTSLLNSEFNLEESEKVEEQEIKEPKAEELISDNDYPSTILVGGMEVNLKPKEKNNG